MCTSGVIERSSKRLNHEPKRWGGEIKYKIKINISKDTSRQRPFLQLRVPLIVKATGKRRLVAMETGLHARPSVFVYGHPASVNVNICFAFGVFDAILIYCSSFI